MYYQRRSPPPNRVHTMTLRDFTGGLNNRSTQLEDNQASDLLNMKFVDDTLMEKRNGVEYYSAFDASSPITYQDVFRPFQEADVHITATDTNVYANGASIRVVRGKVNGRTFLGKYYFADGFDLFVYGTFPQASVSPNVVITGTPNAASLTLRVTSPPSGFTPLPAPNRQGVWHYNYTAGTTWYEPCQYEIDDVYKGSNVIPSQPKYVEVSKDRLYISGSATDNDNVFISDIGNAMYCPVYLPIQMPPNGDEVTGLKVFHDSIVVGRKHDIHIIYGNNNRTDLNTEMFRLKRINAHSGFASQDAIEQVTNYLFYVGSDNNIYSMLTPKTDTDMLITSMLNTQIDITVAPISITSTDTLSAKSVYFDDEWYVAMGDKVLIYSYRHRSWTMYYFKSLRVSSFCIFNSTLIMGTEDGRLIKFNNSYSDLEQPFEAYWKSKGFDAGHPIYEKFYRDFFIIANSFINSPSTIRLAFEIDYIDIASKFDVHNRISLWGVALWGDYFFSRNINASRPFLVGQRGRSIRIILQNGYFEDGSVENLDALQNVSGTTEGMLYYVTSESSYYAYENFTWVLKTPDDLFQPMKVFEINGQYEFRGVR